MARPVAPDQPAPPSKVAILAGGVIASGIAKAGVKTTFAALAFFAAWLVVMTNASHLV
jgi:hypothetical protein